MITIEGLDINIGLDERLPFLDQRFQLVTGHVHSVELGEAVLALDFLNTESDGTERLVLVLLKVG